MIKTIAFDFGDVLMKDTIKDIEKRYWTSKISKSSRTKFIAALRATDTGRASENDLIRAIRQTLATHLTEQQIRKQVFNSKTLPPWKLLQQVAKKYPIAILTNNSRRGPETFAKLLKMDLRSYKIINSSHLGVHKPNPQFYIKALRKLRIKPEELIFIDDVKANVVAAKKLGIKAIQYRKNMGEIRSFMKKQGIKV